MVCSIIASLKTVCLDLYRSTDLILHQEPKVFVIINGHALATLMQSLPLPSPVCSFTHWQEHAPFAPVRKMGQEGLDLGLQLSLIEPLGHTADECPAHLHLAHLPSKLSISPRG